MYTVLESFLKVLALCYNLLKLTRHWQTPFAFQKSQCFYSWRGFFLLDMCSSAQRYNCLQLCYSLQLYWCHSTQLPKDTNGDTINARYLYCISSIKYNIKNILY